MLGTDVHAVIPADAAPAVQRVADGNVFLRVEGLPGAAVEDREVFRAVDDAAEGGGGFVHRAPVGARVAENGPAAVHGAFRSLADQFRPAVPVEVIDDEGGGQVGGADVVAQVDAPEQGAVQFVGIQQGVARDAGPGGDAGVGGLPFEDDLRLPVSVQVGRGAVAGVEGVAVGGVAGVLPVGGPIEALGHAEDLPGLGFLDGNLQVGAGFAARQGEAGQLLAAGFEDPAVRAGEIRFAVQEVGGRADGLLVEFDCAAAVGGAVEVEGEVRLVAGQHAPADVGAVPGAGRDETPAQARILQGLGAGTERQEASSEDAEENLFHRAAGFWF